MRLFISYARVDKPLCKQIVEILDVHEVWFDHRLHAGQKWWEEILRQLTGCDGFVYLLSKESVTSEYCKQEFAIAQSLGKHIFPVLIHPSASIPDALKAIQYVDLSKGLDVTAVKQLLSAIIVAERELIAPPESRSVLLPPEVRQPPAVDHDNVIDQAAEALDSGNFDRAVFLLKRARESGYESRFVDIQAVIKEAEDALERQSYLREAEREYRSIVALVKHQRTFPIGCKSFTAFREHFPDYDPENLLALCSKPAMPSLEWCDVTAGEVVIEREKRRIIHHVEAFKISKFPITNAQFQAFAEASDGYRNDRWWGFSSEACEWHKAHPEVIESRFLGDNYPRANICWYEAMAFCSWFSEKSGKKVTLPTEQQWQRAAQGDTQLRYPWGNKFDKTRCNTNEHELRMTTPVDKYPTGISPFGVYDMAGNVWEWCLTKAPSTNGSSSNGSKITYIVRGGSFLGSAERARNNFYFRLDPLYRYFTIGFRVVELK